MYSTYAIDYPATARASGIDLQTTFKKRNSAQVHGRRRRKRSKAASQEKERLKVFNEALETLQQVLPVRLPKGRKLHKKQTLQVCNNVKAYGGPNDNNRLEPGLSARTNRPMTRPDDCLLLRVVI